MSLEICQHFAQRRLWARQTKESSCGIARKKRGGLVTMDIASFVVLILMVLLFAVVLPALSGVGSFKMQKPARTAPDKANSAKKDKSLKFRLKSADLPDVGFSAGVSSRASQLSTDTRTGLKQRVIGKYDKDPNTFDYTVQDLIDEDEREAAREQQLKFQKYEGKQQAEYEGMV